MFVGNDILQSLAQNPHSEPESSIQKVESRYNQLQPQETE